MIRILFSACLLGDPVRYNGKDLLTRHPMISQWQKEGRLVAICPEVSGGLNVPRPPAEIGQAEGKNVIAGVAKVLTQDGKDVTDSFLLGAQKTLEFAKSSNAQLAIMTERSPSCGSTEIYTGNFDGSKTFGQGVTSALLEQNGIRVFNQHHIEQAALYLEQLLQSH